MGKRTNRTAPLPDVDRSGSDGTMMTQESSADAMAQPNRRAPVIGLLTSSGGTLDAFFLEIIERWQAQGAIVECAAGSPSKGIARQTVLASVTRRPSPRNLGARRELRAWVRDKGIDVVLTNTATASMLARGAGVGAPVVYFCHGLHWNGRRLADLPFRIAERALIPRTGGIVTINSSDEGWFSRNASRTPRLRLLGGVGLDTHRFARRSPIRWDEGGEPLRLVWCGEFSARKDPAAAVELAHALHRRGVDVVLDMLGDGELFDSRDTRSPIEGLVRRRGRTDVVSYFEQAHVLVQTSRWEGLPRVGLEAIAIGLPVVGFDVKGVRDLPAVSVAPSDDIEALAEAVLASARGDHEPLPDPATLSYVHAADMLLEFVDAVATGNFPSGRAYAA